MWSGVIVITATITAGLTVRDPTASKASGSDLIAFQAAASWPRGRSAAGRPARSVGEQRIGVATERRPTTPRLRRGVGGDHRPHHGSICNERPMVFLGRVENRSEDTPDGRDPHATADVPGCLSGSQGRRLRISIEGLRPARHRKSSSDQKEPEHSDLTGQGRSGCIRLLPAIAGPKSGAPTFVAARPASGDAITAVPVFPPRQGGQPGCRCRGPRRREGPGRPAWRPKQRCRALPTSTCRRAPLDQSLGGEDSVT